MKVKNMVGHYILVSYLSSIRVWSAFINPKTTFALCVAAHFNSRRHQFEPVGWMFSSAQFVLALSDERNMLLAKREHDLLRTYSDPDSSIDSQLGCILLPPGQ